MKITKSIPNPEYEKAPFEMSNINAEGQVIKEFGPSLRFSMTNYQKAIHHAQMREWDKVMALAIPPFILSDE